NDRIGGRIETLSGKNGGSIEMGATWFNEDHQDVIALLEELNITYTKQYTKGISFFETSNFEEPQHFTIPENENPSFRINGGTTTILKKLSEKLDSDAIHLNKKVTKINYKKDLFCITTHDQKEYLSDFVISTLPPNLLINSIIFEPVLEKELVATAKKTHTWMGESIKFGLAFNAPFWKDKALSGTMFSHANIVQEMYDHCATDGNFYALKGFLNSNTYSYTKEERQQAVLQQLQRFFGNEINNATQYFEKIWRNERFTFAPYESMVLAHQNNGNSIYSSPFFDNRLFISGSETARNHPGYMNGAIQAAHFINTFFT
ncbi:MAG: flavin monoamine oxidase family protein, partial [Flavobacterium sp.]